MDRKIRTPAFAFPRVPLPLPYIPRPMSVAYLPHVNVIRNLFPRHWPSMLTSCLCRCHPLHSRRVGGIDIATRVGWSGKYHDASRRGIAVEHDVEQGRRTRVDVTRFQWRAGGGARGPGRRRDGQRGTTTPAGSPSPRDAERRRRDHSPVDLRPSSSSFGRLASSLTRMELD